MLGLSVNVAAAALALGGFYFYVFVYTPLAQAHDPAEHRHRRRGRRLPAARRLGRCHGEGLDLGALYLFSLIVFYWTPPHFWALAMKFKDDYARGQRSHAAGRCAPGSAGDAAGSSIYCYVMVAGDPGAGPVRGLPVRGLRSPGLGGWFLVEAHRLHARVSAARPPWRPAGRRPGRGTGAVPDAAVPPVDRVPDPRVRSWWRSVRCCLSATGDRGGRPCRGCETCSR